MTGEKVTVNISQLCPLCNSPIRLFYINFHDKLQMCENTECEFPFGHEELKVFKPGDEISEFDCFSYKTRSRCSSDASSIATLGTCGETEKTYKGRNSDESQSEKSNRGGQPSKIKKIREEDDMILKNINDIALMNKELMALKEESEKRKDDDHVQIRNARWIKNLKNLQEMSGVTLLKPEEMVMLTKEEPEMGLGELKLNIIGEGNASTMSEIRIEIHNTSANKSPTLPVTPETPDSGDLYF